MKKAASAACNSSNCTCTLPRDSPYFSMRHKCLLQLPIPSHKILKNTHLRISCDKSNNFDCIVKGIPGDTVFFPAVSTWWGGIQLLTRFGATAPSTVFLHLAFRERRAFPRPRWHCTRSPSTTPQEPLVVLPHQCSFYGRTVSSCLTISDSAAASHYTGSYCTARTVLIMPRGQLSYTLY